MNNKMFSKRFITAITLCLIGLITFGCSSKSRVGGMLNLDTDLTLEFIIDRDVNPNDSERPSPLYLRLYQLSSPTQFEKSEFVDIYEKDKEILKDELIARQDLSPFIPGETRKERFVLKPGTRYIAIYAEFSQYSKSTYKVVFPVTENNVIRNREKISISGKTVKILKK
jgi:type VI secretion system protein VasD